MEKRLLSLLPEALYFIDRDLRIKYVNPEFTKLIYGESNSSGLDPSNLTGRELSKELIHYQDDSGHRLELYELPAFLSAQSRQEIRKTFYLVTKDGRIPVEERCIPVFKGQDFKGVLCIIKDLSYARIQIEKGLSEQKRQRLLALCAWCKKVRTGDNLWESIERYLTDSGIGTITHGDMS
jgi:PAS domain S-box-containing protein